MDIKLHKEYQKIEEEHWWFKTRDNLLKDIAGRYFKPEASVLDFGCNFGHTVRMLQSLGFMAEGVDVSPEAIKYGRRIGIKNIFLKSEKKFSPQSFDAVIALDVIEHIEDDKEALLYLKSLLKENGVIVITVPAFKFLWGLQDEVAHHFRRYTLSQLKQLVIEAGDLEILKQSYFNTILFLPISIVRFLSRVFKIKNRDSDFSINNAWLNKLFFIIFNLEIKWLKFMSFPFGVSLLMIVQKRPR